VRRENVNSRTHNYSVLVKSSCRVIAKAFSQDVVDLSSKGKCPRFFARTRDPCLIYRYRCNRLATIIVTSDTSLSLFHSREQDTYFIANIVRYLVINLSYFSYSLLEFNIIDVSTHRLLSPTLRSHLANFANS